MGVSDHFRGRLWDSGPRLHVLATFDEAPEVSALARRNQDALAGITALSPVPPPWLHLTVSMLAPSAEVTGIAWAQLAYVLRTRVAEISPFTSLIGPGQASRSHVRLAVADEEPWQHLTTIITATAEIVLGRRLPKTPDLPHITLAYGVRDDPDANLFAVNTVPGRASYTLNRLRLVEEIQDIGNGYYRWDPDTAFPMPLAADRPRRITAGPAQ